LARNAAASFSGEDLAIKNPSKTRSKPTPKPVKDSWGGNLKTRLSFVESLRYSSAPLTEPGAIPG
jgi:hypothetical protein